MTDKSKEIRELDIYKNLERRYQDALKMAEKCNISALLGEMGTAAVEENEAVKLLVEKYGRTGLTEIVNLSAKYHIEILKALQNNCSCKITK